jgi:hypothetical protein
VWNAEGLDFNSGPIYWLVEISGRLHGLTGDMLTHGRSDIHSKGLLFGMTLRNSKTAQGEWAPSVSIDRDPYIY